MRARREVFEKASLDNLHDSGCKVSGLGFWGWASGFKVEGLGHRNIIGIHSPTHLKHPVP